MAGKAIDKLSDLAIKSATLRDKPYKLADGLGLYVEVMPSGSKYWRLKYRYGGKEKRLAIGVYPTVTLKSARQAAREARELLARGGDPVEAKRKNKLARSASTANSFRAVAEEWAKKENPRWSESHIKRVASVLTNNLLPWLGYRPIAEITPAELLTVLRKTESKGTLETAERAKQIAGQVFRYAVATGRAERDLTPDLKGALASPIVTHYAAFTDPKEVGAMLRAFDCCRGSDTVRAALYLSPLLLCRPGGTLSLHP